MNSSSKKTVVLGASPNPERYAHRAVSMLAHQGFEVVPVGLRSGNIAGKPIVTGTPAVSDVHTVTLYVGTDNQQPYYDYILSLQPKRIIFNPGTENYELAQLAEARGIETEFSCTLVLLSIGNY